MRDANVVSLFKNKGDRISGCNNYNRGISLLSIGKAFALCRGGLEKVATPCRSSIQNYSMVLGTEVYHRHDISQTPALAEPRECEKYLKTILLLIAKPQF